MKKQLTIFGAATLLIVGLLSFKSLESSLKVDTSASQLKWTGYHLAKSYEHWGYVSLKSGKATVKNGKITAGEFVIDMNTISSEDVEKESDKAKLVGHLKSDDFFSVEKYPEAKLVIKKMNASGKTTGDLTIRGITKEVEFQTKIEQATDSKLVATADIKVDRTDFKVMYGWKLENAILSNEFRMEVKIVAGS
ncbi:MAG: YceI family protein [Cytophagales bacterium]|nr:YceI family protein [Cytophagales bacterium]